MSDEWYQLLGGAFGRLALRDHDLSSLEPRYYGDPPVLQQSSQERGRHEHISKQVGVPYQSHHPIRFEL